jgi:hypothetical protein
MIVVIRAFNKQGYNKDILVMSEHQIHRSDNRIKSPLLSTLSGLIGVGAAIIPTDFPEMERFEVVIKTES